LQQPFFKEDVRQNVPVDRRCSRFPHCASTGVTVRHKEALSI
jgi:hypothetical protein